ncbi:MAG: hypothetical protein EA412_00320 [Chitinophagaceae bacterium]|nr:MAG: hypothetical protein EA412_00320 [Chitinophagaceae bacterium]
MSTNKKPYFALLGFLLLATGFLSIVFNLMGIRFVFLRFLENLTPLMTLFVHLGMAFGGILIMYLALTDWRDEYAIEPKKDEQDA